jgi:hypothetical protein
MLRDTAAKKLKSNNSFSVYKSIEDFESYLKLQHEQLTDKFIKSILRKASLKFYNPKNQNCLAFKEKLPDKIEDKYSKYISDFKLSDDTQSVIGGLLSTPPKWNPNNGGKYWVSSSQFEKIEERITIIGAQTLHMQKSIFVKLKVYWKPSHQQIMKGFY